MSFRWTVTVAFARNGGIEELDFDAHSSNDAVEIARDVLAAGISGTVRVAPSSVYDVTISKSRHRPGTYSPKKRRRR